MIVETLQTDSLGNRGYIIHDGSYAVAIDVQRDYERWQEIVNNNGLILTHVIETHMHNDYVTGGNILAQATGAEYVIPHDSGASFSAREVADGDEIQVGNLRVTAHHTPGHTPHHMSYSITDDTKTAVFTGGGVLYGTVGRTDLVSPDLTQELTEVQYDSAQKIMQEVDVSAAVFPTHGFGSFCSSSDGTGAQESTLASERDTNIAYTTDRDTFIDTIISGLGAYPTYYAHMGPMNRQGPGPVKALHIHSYSSDAMAEHLKKRDSWVIDTRNRKAFAASHPEGAMGIEMGNSFATYVGWVIPWDNELVLVGESEEAIVAAHTELSRIGMDQFIDGATYDIAGYLESGRERSYQVVTFEDVKRERADDVLLLDVRRTDEYETSHIKGAINIPLHELTHRINEVPNNKRVWAHCASGYRASVAASILDKSGNTPVLISDDFTNAVSLGLTE